MGLAVANLELRRSRAFFCTAEVMDQIDAARTRLCVAAA